MTHCGYGRPMPGGKHLACELEAGHPGACSFVHPHVVARRGHQGIKRGVKGKEKEGT